MQALICTLEFAQNQGYTHADSALKELNKLAGTNFIFEEKVWAGGTYYKVVQIKINEGK